MPSYIEEARVSSSLVARGYLIDSGIMRLLREHFSRNPLQGYQGVKQLIWSPDNRSSGGVNPIDVIKIDLVDTFNPGRSDSLPAIYVSAGDLASIRLGIGDRNTVDHHSNHATRTRAWAGSVTVFSLSSLPRQSKLVAFTCAEHMQGLASEIRTIFNLAKFEVASVKATRPLKEMPTILATPVVLEYGFFDAWHVLPAAPPINHVTQSVALSS